MGKFTLTNAKLYYGQYDLPSDFSECAVDVGTVAVDGAAFGDLVKTVYAGLDTAKVGAAGFFDADSLGVQADPVLQAAVGAAGPVLTVVPVSGAEGETCYSMQSLVSEYDPLASVSVGGMAKFKLSAEAASRMIRGLVLRNTKFSGNPDGVTGTGTIFQPGAVAAGQALWAALHIFSVSGAGASLIAKIQSATTGGFGSPTDRITFAAQTAAGSVWATPVVGPITDQFWRVSFTIAGTTPSFHWLALMGIL